jgi:hypothetical protein
MDLKSIPQFRNEPVLVLILGIVTCGLYLIYWNIKTAEVLNAVVGRELISMPVAVISGCCMPVNLYYYYMAGQALEEVGKVIDKPEAMRNKATLLVVLGFFVPMVSAMIVQGHLNEMYDHIAKQA